MMIKITIPQLVARVIKTHAPRVLVRIRVGNSTLKLKGIEQ